MEERCGSVFFIRIRDEKYYMNCCLEKGHTNPHSFFGDNYHIQWLQEEHSIDCQHSGLTSEAQNLCMKNMALEKINEVYNFLDFIKTNEWSENH